MVKYQSMTGKVIILKSLPINHILRKVTFYFLSVSLSSRDPTAPSLPRKPGVQKLLKKEIFFQMQQDGGGRPQLCSHGETLLHIPQCTRLSGVQRVWVAKFPKEEGNR